ncbi:TIR domain-containing protein [Porphyromonas canoris]|uniref:TIR domain-containing protein n=1 Tax=Porphyromonas canoris TaxID=36875 RepID=UPI002934C06F|nr:COR domain-containing protein [Porphyromonas canoris]
MLQINGNPFLYEEGIILAPFTNHKNDILNLLSEKKEKKEEFEYPYKVMLLGNHEAGKSTFLRYYDKKYTLNGSTHILQIFKSQKESFPKINFYDFGGQDYYHGIYQVFFSNNALNMLFWCDKTDRNKKGKDREGINILNFNRAYWLSQIQYASQRKELYQSKEEEEEDTFVIQTHADNSKQKTIEKTAPQVIEQFFISLPDTKESEKEEKRKRKERRKGYNNALRYLVFRLKSEIEKKDTQKQYPESQIKLYKKIQSLQKETGYNCREIRELFPSYKESKESLLKAKLYQLYRKGEILYYRGDKELENVVWLNPVKTVEHIHSILSKDSMKQMKGRVPKANMKEVFEKDPLLLRLLEIEKVIFHDQKKGVYIIPGYLPLAEEEEAYSWLTIGFLAPNFTLKFESFIPFGLINQLICYYGSGENELKRYWRDQLIFTLRGEYMVWIALDFEKLKIEVYINPLPKGKQTKVVEIEEEIFLDLFCFYWDKRPLQKGIESETPKFSQRERESENKTQRELEIRNRIKQELKLERQKNPIPDLYISCYDPKLKPEGQLYVKLQKLDDPEQTKSTITAYPLTQEGEINREKELRVSTKRYKHFSINPDLRSIKRIFISYSKSDIDDLNELNKFLTDMIREEKIEVYYDKTTTPGDLIHEVIKEKIIEADYVIALVSQNYISTDYIRDVELPLIKEHNKPLIPIIIKPCTWTMNDISKHYAVLKGAEISFPDWNKGSNPDNYNACRSENWRKAVEELNEKIFTNKYN